MGSAPLGMPTPNLDAFAAPHNALFARYWTREVNALAQPWGDSLLPLWANPPFSLVSAVLDKIEREKCFLVLICPEWHRFHRRAVRLARKAVLLPPPPDRFFGARDGICCPSHVGPCGLS